MKIETAKLVDLATPIAKQVQVKTIYLARSKSARNPHVTEVPDTVDFQFGLNAEARLDRDSKTIAVTTFFGIEGTEGTEGTEQPRSVFQIDAVFSVDYTLQYLEGIGDVNVEAFGYVNGLFNTYPYWREYVQSQVNRMGLPNLTLPVLTLAALLKMHEKQNAREGEQVSDEAPLK